MTFHRAAFASILFCPLALNAAGDRATVKAEAAHVYANQRTSAEEIVATLKRGHAVSVEMQISSSEGNWCEIAGPAGSGLRGFMRCADLESEQRHSKVAAAYIPDAPPSTAAAKPPVAAPGTRPAPRTLAEVTGDEYMRPIQYWTRTFNFTADQQKALADLARRTGVTGCRERIEAHVREYETELNAPPGTPPRERLEQMAGDFNRFAHPCMMKQLELLERLPAMMTPGQQADRKLLTSFKIDLARHRQVLTSPDTYPGIATPR